MIREQDRDDFEFEDVDAEGLKRFWIIVVVMLLIGVLGIVFISLHSKVINQGMNFSEILTVIGSALLVAGASFTTGGITGFLFGIPKVVQNDALNEEKRKNNKTLIIHNDNLVQISDWLTKIIVGVGLTQLNEIPHFVGKVANYFGSVFAGNTPAVVSVIFYFLILGFFVVYLWTRLFFVRLLRITNEDLEKELEETKSALIETQKAIAIQTDELTKLKTQADTP